MILNGCPVTWGSRQQQSMTEVEYVAACETARQVAWLRNLLKDIGLVQKTATQLFCDNHGAFHLSKNPENHKRTKHIDVQFHYVRKSQAEGIISAKYVSTTKQLADMFTKSLPRHNLKCLVTLYLCILFQGLFHQPYRFGFLN